MKKIAAIIVTFNRKELLLKNIMSCFNQNCKIDCIFIIDNHGTDNTYDFLKNNLSYNQMQFISYIYLPENIGGSGGFSFGTKLAYEKGYEYFLLMDDDGRPYNENCLSELYVSIEKLNLKNRPFLFNSLVLSDYDEILSFGLLLEGKLIFNKNALKVEYLSDSINPFNGTFFNKQLLDKIGFPRGDYFIKGDEVEFYMRARKYEIPIYTIIKSEYYHPSPFVHSSKKRILWKCVVNNIESPWKEYYTMRNTVLNFKEYINLWKIKSFLFYIKRVIKIYIFSDDRKKTIELCKQGYKDGKKGKTGIVYLPGNVRV